MARKQTADVRNGSKAATPPMSAMGGKRTLASALRFIRSLNGYTLRQSDYIEVRKVISGPLWWTL